MFLPQIALADRKGEVVSYVSGVPRVVDNNIDVTYTGKTWKDAQGNNKYEYVARISQAPIYNDDGSLVDCSWHGQEDAYIIINNVFSAQVIGAYITTTYQGQSMSWNPVVMVDSREYVAKSSPRLLVVDPVNSNYKNNTLEWDYGVCVRRVRVIEGLIQETWTFASDPKGTVWIKDNAQKSAGFSWAIAPYAYDADGNVIPINQYKQVLASDMAKAVYPVTIDPTEVFVTSASDGVLTGYSSTYATAQAAASTDYIDTTSTYFLIGQKTSYYIYKGFVYFDTSAIPDSATISAVNVSLYGSYDYSSTDFNISVQSGMPTYPHDPLVGGDYDKTLYDVNGVGNAGFSTAGFSTAGYNNISLNATGMAWVSKVGTTKLCLRSNEDIIASQPASNEYVRIYSYEKGAGYRPTLYVTYSSSGTPTVTTNPASYVTKTTAQLNGYLDADGGEANTVSFNYQPWYSLGWQDCIEFTINASYVDADLTNFPVLVTGTGLNSTDTDFWTTVNSSGSDILFTASDGVTKLNRELVSINTTAQTMECYVNVTSIDDVNNTKFYLYYNSSNIALYNESNSTATWDANYIAVWHMNDLNTSAIADSTANAQTGIKKGANEPLVTTGLIGSSLGSAQLFDGVNDYVNVSHNANQLLTTAGTISAVIYPYTSGESQARIVDKAGAAGALGYSFGVTSGNSKTYLFMNGSTSSLSSANSWAINTTTFDAVSFNATGFITFYKNGDTWGTASSGQLASSMTSTNPLYIGQRSGATDRTFKGSIDEVRVSNISRSDSWIKATYYTLMLPTSFAPVTDVFTTTTTQSKNTGDSFYISQTGLTANTLYGYKAEALNSYGTSWGHWVFFDTTVTLGSPANVSCSASSNSIILSWVKGGNTSYTYIRYKVGSYPTSSTDGNAIANQSGVSYTHTGLASGTSYYYKLWGEDGGDLSTTNSTTMCTTTASGPTTTTVPLPTVDTSGFDTAPNGSALSNNPLYPLGNLEAAAISVPQPTWWMLVGLGGLVVTGLFIYTRSRNLLIALGAMMIFGVIMSQMSIFPIWVMYVFALAGIGMSWKELR
jgi:hypothetical protein